MSSANISSEISGRKVFFLFPTAAVQNHIITELIQHEYEVYVAKKPARLIRTLKKYDDSVLFINLDDGMTEQEWDRWIRTAMIEYKEIKIGILSASSDDEIKEKYLNKIKVSCGFISSKQNTDNIFKTIHETLHNINVKGRRKYVRASTERETSATINMPYHGDFIKGTIKDISAVGISCSFEKDIELTKNSLVKDVQLRLQSMLLKVEAIMFGSRPERNGTIYVFIFTQRVDPDMRRKIRIYIQGNLQAKMDAEIN